MIGPTIAQYRIIRELGRGAMGVVYLAEHVVLGRRVAIKTVSSNYGRFLREARAASALSHPHIATIHDYGKTDSGQPYIVMEYIEGKTLADLIFQGNLTIPKSLRIVREVAEALGNQYAARHFPGHQCAYSLYSPQQRPFLFRCLTQRPPADQPDTGPARLFWCPYL